MTRAEAFEHALHIMKSYTVLLGKICNIDHDDEARAYIVTHKGDIKAYIVHA